MTGYSTGGEQPLTRVNSCRFAVNSQCRCCRDGSVKRSLGDRRSLKDADAKLFSKGKLMPFVMTQPEALVITASNLGGLGSGLNAQNAAAAGPTTGVIPAAADEVSVLTATHFALHAAMYQQVSAQAAAIHEMFVATMNSSAASYAATEAANAAAVG